MLVATSTEVHYHHPLRENQNVKKRKYSGDPGLLTDINVSFFNIVIIINFRIMQHLSRLFYGKSSEQFYNLSINIYNFESSNIKSTSDRV